MLDCRNNHTPVFSSWSLFNIFFIRVLAITLQLLLFGEVRSTCYEDWKKSNGPVLTSVRPEFEVKSKTNMGGRSKTVSWKTQSFNDFMVSSVSLFNDVHPLLLMNSNMIKELTGNKDNCISMKPKPHGREWEYTCWYFHSGLFENVGSLLSGRNI